MAQDPWAKFRVGAPAAPAATAADPIIKPADPYKAEDQQMQREANARAAAAADRQAAAAERAAAAEERKIQMDALGTESERTAGFLAGRISDAVKRLVPAAQQRPSAQGPTVGVEAVRKVAGDSAANFFTNSERQQVRAAQLDILDAALTLGTGAAYTREQLNNYAESYLPQLFDTPDAIKSKRQALRNLLEEASRKAGRSAPDIQAAMAALDQLPDIGAPEPDNPDGLTGSVTDDSPAIGGATPPNGGGPGGGPGDGLTIDPNGPGGLLTLAKQGITLGLSDEAAGIGGAIGAGLTGRDPSAAYTRERDLARREVDASRQAWPILGTAAEFIGGGAAGRIASAPSGVLQVARQGAGMGGIAGFGYGEGGASVPNALLGAATGGAVGAGLYGAGAGINALVQRRAAPNVNLEVVQAGQRQNIPVRQPDARPELRGKYAAAESTEKGGPLINAARAEDAAAIGQRAADVAGGNAYNRADTTAMGQRVQAIAEDQQGNVKNAASALYKRVDRAAPDFAAPANQTAAFIDNKIAELQAASPTGYKAEVDALLAMKSDLQQTGLSVRSLQAQRETVGGRIGDNIQDRTRADRTFTEVLDVAANELHSALRATNPQAAEMLSRADAKWGQYKRIQREVTGLFLGKRGDSTAEGAAKALEATTRNNYAALRRFMAMASPEDRADFAATFVQNWGANQRGEFTPSLFAKNLEKVSNRTLDALVGQDGRAALRDLQILANAKTDAMARQAPSGKAMERVGGGLKTLIMSALGFTTAGPAGAVAGGAARELLAKWGEQRAARMLLNPDFTKWLRNAPNATNPKAIDRYFAKLGAIGSIAANDNAAFVGAIRSAFGGPRAAAAQDEQKPVNIPPQQ